ncbi:hypothetical protein LWI28_024501 [Acer negundo]|uniref:Integrase catalytic domain-containing protein n=1 Tax=Acer negundo TaxID=4023 RepID=A0AAD5NSA4_ACENE|nr:hypothetical protein LWI28_024501 [Acer negundo]
MEYIMSFLMGLNDSFSQVRGQLLLIDSFPPINRVLALISQEEHQRKVGVLANNGSDVSNTMAFTAKVNISDKKSNDGTGYKGQKKDRPYCTHCKIHGHTIDRCFKIHGYPPGYKPKPRDNNLYNVGSNSVNQVSGYAMQSDQASPSNFFQNLNSTQYQQLMTMLSTHLPYSSKSINELQPTTAASFTTSTCFSVTNSTITLPNHTRIPVSLAGDVQISPALILKDVLFVPAFKFNLLSVSALTFGTKLTVQFLPVHFEIQELCSQKMIGKGERVEDLYVLDAAVLNSVSSAYVNNVSAQVWYNRLGHISFKRLDILKSHLHNDTSKLNKASPCYICPLAKQRRLSFDSHNHLSQSSFDLVHCDIWGPYHVPSYNGFRYFLTLVDDCSRFTWIYLLKYKFDVSHLHYDTSKLNKASPCYICPLAKQRRLSFDSHNHLSQSFFDLVHCDIWGPYYVPSYNGFRYFLTLVDDCSRFTWIYLLKHKSDVASIIPNFLKMVETQLNAKIKVFRSDNAPELVFFEFFSSNGVLHHFSCVERPQQNSVVEKKHQHLLNVARALYFQSRVPIKFWNECVLAVTFLINRTPTPLLHHKTPYEVLYQTSVDYSYFRVFGCLTFASTLTAHRTKFDPRSRVCVFIGYPLGIKGYRLFDVRTKQVFVSRDVIFHEEIFPFHTIATFESLIDPFPEFVLPLSASSVVHSTSLTSPSISLHPESEANPPLVVASRESEILISDPISMPHTDVVDVSPTQSPLDSHIDHPEETIPHDHNTHLRRSSRVPQPPSYLRDFHCSLVSQHDVSSPVCSTAYPLNEVLSYQSLSPTYKNFVLNVSSHYEPHFFHQVAKYLELRAAMKTELDAMESNNTWSITPLPKALEAYFSPNSDSKQASVVPKDRTKKGKHEGKAACGRLRDLAYGGRPKQKDNGKLEGKDGRCRTRVP